MSYDRVSLTCPPNRVNSRSPRPVRHVTPRQRAVLDLALRGLTDKEIATDLGISVSTVRTYLERFYREHGLRNKTEAVAAWQHYREMERRQTGKRVNRSRPPMRNG